MAARIAFMLLMLSTRLQADTHRDEPKTECFSASLKEEIREFLHQEIRQVETNIVRRLNDTIKEHNKHNNDGQEFFFKKHQIDRQEIWVAIKTIDAYLREIHPMVQSLLDGNATAYRRETKNQLDQMAATLTQYRRETKNQLDQMAATLAQLKVTSFTLPPHEDVDMSHTGKLFVLHKDREMVSLYHPDAAAGFRLQWTGPAPAATGGRSWDKIRAAGDGRALLHDLWTETVLLAADGTEAGRWQVEDPGLWAASSSHVVYAEGSFGNRQLHVYTTTDHSTRLFSLRPRDGGSWGDPVVDISPAGTVFVADKDKKLLAAFSSTGARLYQVPTAYTPLNHYRAVTSNDQHVFVLDRHRRDVVHVHAAASGNHVTTLTAMRLQLQDGEEIHGVWAGRGQTLYVWARAINRIITYRDLEI